MSEFDYNRIRNHTMSFRVSDEERRQLKARIMVTGLPVGRYILESALNQKICIAVGKYQSDRLSIELRKLREQLAETGKNSEELNELVTDCTYLLEQLMELITTDQQRNFRQMILGRSKGKKYQKILKMSLPKTGTLQSRKS